MIRLSVNRTLKWTTLAKILNLFEAIPETCRNPAFGYGIIRAKRLIECTCIKHIQFVNHDRFLSIVRYCCRSLHTPTRKVLLKAEKAVIVRDVGAGVIIASQRVTGANNDSAEVITRQGALHFL